MDPNLGLYASSALVFVAVVLLVEGLYLLLRSLRGDGRTRFLDRVRTLSAGGEHGTSTPDLIKSDRFSDLPWLNRLLAYIPRIQVLDRMLVQSGVNLSVPRFLALGLGMAGGLFLALAAVAGWNLLPAVVVGAAAGIGVPLLWLRRRVAQNQARFAEILPDALDFLARSLRAGNPFPASLHAAAGELPEPVASQFRLTFEEVNFGLDLESALYNLASRVGLPEVHYFATAVNLQRATGGNLADLLTRLAEIIRARQRTYREVQINAAEMKMSAHVLIALPFVVAGAISVMNPEYLAPLVTEPFGRMILGAQLVLFLVGYFVIRRMVNFHI
ncbi:MAG: type II secretion system F family protein [Thiohalorhabdus sp.]|uniref:type II secretion system F family protein n=1 Tax=Thiohalorhabdus sp. TaxID=3094134 RepID=UPI003980D9DC